MQEVGGSIPPGSTILSMISIFEVGTSVTMGVSRKAVTRCNGRDDLASAWRDATKISSSYHKLCFSKFVEPTRRWMRLVIQEVIRKIK